MDYSNLMDQAIEASKFSYSPYSKFPVGAAVLCESGKTYFGCNMENASFGMTICAERNAITTAIAHGERVLRAVAIYSPKMNVCYPCGACRQVIDEFKPENGDVDIVLKNNDELEVLKISELLPGEFRL